MKEKNKDFEEAVSPVVGVMLMLVVTIIIAAVVSGFATGLGAGEKNAPQMTAETKIINTGYYYGSYFSLVVTGVSEPIPSSDLKIVTSWKANGTMNTTNIIPGVENFEYSSTQHGVAPWATGTGIEFGMNNIKNPEQWFGNYSISPGTSMRAYPCGAWGPNVDPAIYGGYGPGPDATYVYTDGTGYTIGDCIDPMQAVLGYNWNNLRNGDIVTVKILHTPSGKVIYDDNVAVQGG
ncbi:type IV pilin N-terminal domain-containing protein [Methanoplanus limicola]|uniref:Flagellin domain protein n=1 Tax=Methanoplanus limicola DSM 2279 TaxID=937775 RepID=H1Z240_9EURY|nr:type IV pilin N-terminal domain-containing protein [Methanoplanus limicola]EHQ36385.1 flagellin domain protein [Methanoplanus limicola DSM 2279]